MMTITIIVGVIIATTGSERLDRRPQWRLAIAPEFVRALYGPEGSTENFQLRTTVSMMPQATAA
jgi:hypothetical protein